MSSKTDLPPIVVLFGRPGAGKGTLAQILVANHKFVQCSTGQAMRAWAEGPSPEQKALKATLARGEYGSDELAARIVLNFLENLPSNTAGVVLDGFPRSPAQLAAFIASGATTRSPILGLEIIISEELARSRIARRGYCPVDGWSRIDLGPCQHCGGPTIHRPEDLDSAALARRFADYERFVEPTIAAWKYSKLPLQSLRNDDNAHPLQLWGRWINLYLHAQ